MKRLNLLVILLVTAAILLAGCGSDDNANEEQTNSVTSERNKTSTTKSNEVQMNAAMKADIETFKKQVTDSCTLTKPGYDKFKNTGDSDDGWREVSTAGENLIGTLDTIDTFNFDNWPEDQGEYDKNGLYQREIYPLIVDLGNIKTKMFKIFVDSANHSADEIHSLMKEYEDTINNSKYGTCSLT